VIMESFDDSIEKILIHPSSKEDFIALLGEKVELVFQSNPWLGVPVLSDSNLSLSIIYVIFRNGSVRCYDVFTGMSIHQRKTEQ